MVDYGTFNAGNFDSWNGALAIPVSVVSSADMPVNGNWGPVGVQTLTNAPASLNVRARLQKRSGMGAWTTVSTDYATCP